MAFHKTGIIPIEKVKCNCGHDIKGHIHKCPQCGKSLVPENLQTTPKDTAPQKTEKSVVK